MTKAAAANGWIDEKKSRWNPDSIRRAGADFILTYYAHGSRPVAGMNSKKLFARAQKVLVGGVNSPVRAYKAVGARPSSWPRAPAPTSRTRAASATSTIACPGARSCWSHARREIAAAAIRALGKGSTFGAATEGEVALGERLQAALPSLQRLRLTSSGTESVMSALRLARAYTKRPDP